MSRVMPILIVIEEKLAERQKNWVREWMEKHPVMEPNDLTIEAIVELIANMSAATIFPQMKDARIEFGPVASTG